MKIIIKSETVLSEDRRDGQGGTYKVFFQEALFSGGDEVLKVRVPVSAPSGGYASGEYTFASASFVRNKYQSLEMGRLVLEPLRAVASVSAVK